MKWMAGWFIVFVVSWGVGLILCGISAWQKNSKATTVIAIIFFGLPLLGLVFDIANQDSIEHNYLASVAEMKALCAKDGGDKIYKTVDNVQGVMQLRERQASTYRLSNGLNREYLSDQFGMEDPYGWNQGDGDVKSLIGFGQNLDSREGDANYWFVEQRIKSGIQYQYVRNYLSDSGEKLKFDGYGVRAGDPAYKIKVLNILHPQSLYGYITEDLTTKDMRKKWIAAGRIKIINLQTQEILAIRTGYLVAPGSLLPKSGLRWASGGYVMCPFPPNNESLIKFLHSVLKPQKGFPSSDELDLIRKD